MACSCRSAALRIFVRGVSQLHKTDSLQGSFTAVRQYCRPRLAGTFSRTAYRGLHSSPQCRSEATSQASEAAEPENQASEATEKPAPEAAEQPAPAAEDVQTSGEPSDDGSIQDTTGQVEITPEVVEALAAQIGELSTDTPPEQEQQPTPDQDETPADYGAVSELTSEAIDAIALEIQAAYQAASSGVVIPSPDVEETSAPRKRHRKPRSDEPAERQPTTMTRKIRRLMQFGPGDTAPTNDLTALEQKQKRRINKILAKKDAKMEKKLAKKAEVAAKKAEKAAGETSDMPVRPRADKPRADRDGKPRAEREPWMIQKEALKAKFGDEGWKPMKKLSPDALAGIRALHAQYPETYTTAALSQKFELSPEAIRRILRSKWTPSAGEEINRQDRWFNRGKEIWQHKAELGVKPPRKWRDEGVKTNWPVKREFMRRKREVRERDEAEWAAEDGREVRMPHAVRGARPAFRGPGARTGAPRRFGGRGGSGHREREREELVRRELEM